MATGSRAGALDIVGGNGPASITNCTFIDNSCSAYGGAGGAIVDGGSPAPTITGCAFTGNAAGPGDGSGGALYLFGDTSLIDCTITGNAAKNGGGICSDKAGVSVGAAPQYNIYINPGALSLTGCLIAGNSAQGSGGGVFNDGGMTLTQCSLSGNTANSGAGIFDGTISIAYGYYGKNYAGAVADLNNCTLTGNSATLYGGGIVNQGALTLTECTLSGNTAKAGGGLDDLKRVVGNPYAPLVPNSASLSYCAITGNSASTYGGGVMNEGALDLTDCTISGDTAMHDGGGLANISLSFFYGFQYSPPVAVATVTNSTLYGNTSLYGGAISNEAAKLTLANDTVTANRTTGVGNYAAALGTITSKGDILLYNTLIAGNSNGVSPNTAPGDVANTIDPKSAYNLIGDGDLLTGISNGTQGNQIGSASAGTVINAGLGPLANNDGPTETIALLAGSPAIDAGSNALAIDPGTQQALPSDQRGPGYARIINGTVDIGAFEYGAVLVTPTQLAATPPPTSPLAVTANLSLTITAEDNSGDTAIAFGSPVTVQIASGPAGGTLSGTLTETADSGVASFSGLTFNEPGSYVLTVSGGGLSGSIGPIQVVAGPAVQLVLTTEPPADVGLDEEFQVVVAAEDSLGFVDASYSGTATVSLISNPGVATLGGVLTVAIEDGVATFSGLTLNVADDGYLLQVTSTTLVPATTSTVDVTLMDTSPPTSSVKPLPATTAATSLIVSWSGTPGAGATSIVSYTIYDSDDGGPFTAFLTNTTSTSTTFTGRIGHTYGFYSVATNNLGTVQPTPTAAQATTTVVNTPTPTVSVNSISPVTPATRNTPVTSATVILNEPAGPNGFTTSALTLTDSGGPNLISGAVSITLVSGSTYQIGGLSGLTGAGGSYVLTINAADIENSSGNAGTGLASTSWLMDTTPPTSTVDRLPSQTNSTSFTVAAAAFDPNGANGSTPSGVASIAIYGSINGGAFVLFTTVSEISPLGDLRGSGRQHLRLFQYRDRQRRQRPADPRRSPGHDSRGQHAHANSDGDHRPATAPPAQAEQEGQTERQAGPLWFHVRLRHRAQFRGRRKRRQLPGRYHHHQEGQEEERDDFASDHQVHGLVSRGERRGRDHAARQ